MILIQIILNNFLYKNFYVCIMNFLILVPEDGQLTDTCKGNKYLQIESHWTVLTIIL
jgi:hypothetical protein